MNCDCSVAAPATHSLASICSGNQLVFFFAILDNYLRQNCKIADPCTQFHPRTHIYSYYDFIVIGGGSAGSTIAGRLASSNFSVLLLETGSEECAANQVPAFYRNFGKTELDWQYITEPESAACLNQEGQRCYWPRGKILGGSGAINGLVYLRGSRKDFDDWAHLGNPGWSYDEVLPFFLRSEDNQQLDKMDKAYHSIGGPLSVSSYSDIPSISQNIIDAGRELGYPKVDLNGKTHTGFSILQATIKNGHRMSTARAFLRPLHNWPNLHVMLESTATKIIFDNDKRATGVEFYHNDHRYQIGVTKEVIVSGGTVDSPQILMKSGIGPARHLAAVGISTVQHLPGVGENLQDHVAIGLGISINETEETIFNFNTFNEYIHSGTGPFSQSGLNQVTALINTKYADASEDNPDIQLLFGGYEGFCDKIGMTEEIIGDRRSFAILPTVLRPKSHGLIRLRNNNPFSKPMIFPQYLTNPDDVERFIEGIKFAVKLLETKALKKIDPILNKTPTKGCEQYPYGSDSYWRCAVKRDTIPMNHQVGTCKMGPSSDPLSVVDSQLRVHGVKGVRVADASIMPVMVSGNTMATTIMIGEKAAEFIRSTYA